MIKLRKLRLINWHYFVNTTADIENITFLTGANGTGKSTIIDALQIVLLGDTTGRNFNKAANEKTGRTLRGYLRCETGETSEGKVVALRPGRFTSYIALEFYDTVKDSHFTLGIVFECYADGRDDRHFFYLDSGFPQNNFTNRDLLDKDVAPRALTYQELESFLASSQTKYRFFETNEQYRQFLKVKLGNLPDKYFTLFKKSVSFTPISDISQFITEFVCDVDKKVDIEPMRKNIEQYRMLQVRSQEIKAKIAELQKIQDTFDQYDKMRISLGALTYVNAKADFEYAQKNVESAEDEKRRNQDKLQSVAVQLSQIDGQIDELRGEKESWLAKKVGSEGYSLSSDLGKKKQDFEQRITSLKMQAQNIVKHLYQYCDDFEVAARAAISAFKDVDLHELNLEERDLDLCSEFIDFSSEIISRCTAVKAECQSNSVDPEGLESLQKDLDSYRAKASTLGAKIDQALFSASTERDDLSQQMRNIGSGKKPLPGIYVSVLKEFTSQLQASHPDAEVRMFADCVDVNDPSWTTAIEACLGGTRFNVFVDPEYYSEAYALMAKIARNYDYYSLNIIDSERVIEHMKDHPASPSSCASLIDADSEEARAYADFLLGRIRKCESFSEARNAGSGLLANCTGYRNFTTWYLRKPQNLILGTKVDSRSAEQIHSDFSKLDKAVSILSSIRDHVISIGSIPTMSINEATTYRNDLLACREIPDLEANVTRLAQQMTEGSLKDVSAIDEKLRAIDADIADLAKKRESLTMDKGAFKSAIERIDTEVLPERRDVLDRARIEMEKFTPDQAQQYDPYYQELVQQMDIREVKNEANRRYRRFVEKQKVLKDQLLSLRSRYVTAYNLAYDVSSETSNEPFSSELNNLSVVMLPQYNKKIEEAHSSAVKEFKDDFVFKLRGLIETVQSQIAELNDALVDVRFGRDSYRFVTTPNKALIEYYEMIMDPMLLSTGDADVFMEKYKNLMEQLFAQIADESDAQSEDREKIKANIERFTDYTTYLNFDLLVKRGIGPNATETSLAHSFKRQSGGETQTPFYISILASFAQLYRCSSDADTLRLVIFDEAFSKMDSIRIKEAVNLLRGFGLQGLISTPPEKLRDLAKLVDESLVAIHSDKNRVSYLDLYQDTNRKIGPIKAWNLKDREPEKPGEDAGEPADAAQPTVEPQPDGSEPVLDQK